MKKYVCDKNFDILWDVFIVNINCAETLTYQWQGTFGLWDERLLSLSCPNFPISKFKNVVILIFFLFTHGLFHHGGGHKDAENHDLAVA